MDEGQKQLLGRFFIVLFFIVFRPFSRFPLSVFSSFSHPCFYRFPSDHGSVFSPFSFGRSRRCLCGCFFLCRCLCLCRGRLSCKCALPLVCTPSAVSTDGTFSVRFRCVVGTFSVRFRYVFYTFLRVSRCVCGWLCLHFCRHHRFLTVFPSVFSPFSGSFFLRFPFHGPDSLDSFSRQGPPKTENYEQTARTLFLQLSPAVSG